ncbi:MAG TPA: phosphatase PAP2 family protein [Allosphingosinicella sp.]|jgi:acid phosphatase (class A)|nr:phosphatase PAP2 family protein [Allosphingosinicella sp.]
MRSVLRAAFISALAGQLAFAAPAAAAPNPYLRVEPQVANWLPPQPQSGDLTDDSDLAIYYTTRPLAAPGSPSVVDAQADDVLSAPTVAQRFATAAGGTLDATNAPAFMTMMTRVLDDDGAMLAPLKHDVVDGGRVRPYVRFAQQNVCDHLVDDRDYRLDKTGSYPSGHATYGWMWGLILSTILSERADAIMAKAYGFGQSRLVCGFHYPSDLLAGRLAASALFARLMTDPAFAGDLKRARVEVRKALGLPAVP